MCHNIGKQLSGPHVNKGFPYMDDGTKPLCGQICVTILENNCQDPVLIRVSPRWMMTQNHFVGRHNHYVHATPTPTVAHYWKRTVRAPYLYGFPLYGWRQETTSWAAITTTYTQHPHPPWRTIGEQLSGPHIYKGFPYMDEGRKPLREQA